MKHAIKYIYGASPFYVYCRRHFCPHCGAKLTLQHKSKIVNSNSPEAKDYDFSIGDTFLVGDVEFRIKHFYCPTCKLAISFQDMKKHEMNKHHK